MKSAYINMVAETSQIKQAGKMNHVRSPLSLKCCWTTESKGRLILRCFSWEIDKIVYLPSEISATLLSLIQFFPDQMKWAAMHITACKHLESEQKHHKSEVNLKLSSRAARLTHSHSRCDTLKFPFAHEGLKESFDTVCPDTHSLQFEWEKRNADRSRWILASCAASQTLYVEEKWAVFPDICPGSTVHPFVLGLSSGFLEQLYFSPSEHWLNWLY